MTGKQQAEQLTEVLKILLRFSKVRHRDIEERLGFSGGYMSRLLSGKIDIKISHVLSLAEILDIRLHELFAIAFPEDGSKRPSPGLQSIRKVFPNLIPPLLEPAPEEAPTPGRDLKELQQTLEAGFNEVLVRTFAGREKKEV
jgi:transcriptional regulator with XRE-family HTH domain